MGVIRTIYSTTILFCIYSLLSSEQYFSDISQVESYVVEAKKSKRRVVLRENLVNGVNTLSQQMLDRYGSNTRFIIKYDFVVGGDILIPDNCELIFEGGKFRNGKVDFNFCKISSTHKALYNIRFSHLCDFDIHYFDIPQDATHLLQDIVNSCNDVDLGDNTFLIHKVITIDGHGGLFNIKNGVISALEKYDIYEGENLVPNGSMLFFYDISNGSVKNLKINGNRYAQRGLFISKCTNLVVENCNICGFDGKDKAPSWGVRCQNCSDIKLYNSQVCDIYALPVGVIGKPLGGSKGVVFENTYNSYIVNNIIENVQSTKDGDALHIAAVPVVNGAPAPSRLDLYKDVNIVVAKNVIIGNENSKRCVKIQANGVKIIDNYIQKLFVNATNAVSIYASNIVFSNNTIDSQELYTIGLGASYLNMIHDVIISKNKIYHGPQSDWRSCIYMLESSMKNILIDSNVVSISNSLNYFCDLRIGVDSFVVSNNEVIGGRQLFRIYVTKDNSEIDNLQLIRNHYEGDKGFLIIREKAGVKADYHSITASYNTFVGVNESAKMFDVCDNPVIKKSITIDKNSSNKILGL